MIRRCHGTRDDAFRPFCWLATVVVVGAAACSTSASGEPGRDAGVDATIDVPGEVLADKPDALHDDAAPLTDAQAEQGGGSTDGTAPVVCEALADGSCSPAPDPSLPMCNGCYGYPGQRYDSDAKCLYGSVPETLVCTTVCVAGAAQQCYVRETDGSVEVLFLGYHFWDATFEQETGLTKCDQALSQEVMNAPMCE